ncbi:ELMO/CED-12 family-domain-containing protein [Piptocephalis cylindrospora]|uniref:ELMO/CED-12 family-domain-containing protein n=1 Tax=Piptocephalis cylindrospora TaxID=1907219 RepID=A0A4P9Y9B7_9FUNG|nr:ELMO/CED-12 family-domain-containing protein [Piptocephalis cylindrospora]|eukprot:RKP15434.1 ELMO/CED-12 family-domain-containing protein [Piptocephalis cylindrospora]
MLSTDVDIEYEGITHPATLDLSLPLDQLVRNLVHISLAVPVDPTTLALRLASTKELLSDTNIRRRVTHGDRLLLVPSPGAEALALVKILRSSDRERDLKKYIFTLQKALKEAEFSREFVDLAGIHILVDVIHTTTGNALAYALTSMLHLCEHAYGLEKLPGSFLDDLTQIILTQALTTISRPATLILAQLVSTPQPPTTTPAPCLSYASIHPLLQGSSLLQALSGRLSSPDFLLAQAALTLLITLLAEASSADQGPWLSQKYVDLGVRAEVAKLMRMECGEEMSKLIRDFQRLVLQDQRRAKRSAIQADDSRFDTLWELSGIGRSIPSGSGSDESGDTALDTGARRWRALGFETESPHRELLRVGSLGLDLLVSAAKADPTYFRDHISAQQARPMERRCPWARTAAEAVELLADQLHISTGYATGTAFQPLQLLLPETHHVTLLAIHRAWKELGASSSSPRDLATVSALVLSQLRYALREDSPSSLGLWDFRRTMLEGDFAQDRVRQLRDLAVEDDLLSKLPVRSLRDRIYRESYEFMKQQRIDCLLRGAWFPTPPPFLLPPGSTVPSRSVRQRPWRYYRLSPDKRTLHWGEFSERTGLDGSATSGSMSTGEGPGLEKLPDKVDLMLVTHIVVGLIPGPGIPSKRMEGWPVHSAVSLPPLGFALMCGSERTLATFVAPDRQVFAEWTDGFHMLFDRNIGSKETADLIQGLTETMTRVYLLGVGAERVEVPTFREPPSEPPEDYDFYYSEL